MLSNKNTELYVGAFVLASIAAILFLCLKVSNVDWFNNRSTYRIYASFDNVNDLKIHSPVTIGGVVVGEIKNITLDQHTYRPFVEIVIYKNYNAIPKNSSIVSRTSGLLGEKYLSILPGFLDDKTKTLQDGDTIQDTQSSIILEDIIGHLINKN